MSVDIMSIFILVVAYLLASIFYPMLAGGAGYTPTPRRAVGKALGLVDLKKIEVFYDLGCGTGEALIEASRLCDHVKGVEIEPTRWFIAKLRARKARVVLGNLFKQDISDANVIFIFQYKGGINSRIAKKIMSETQGGTRIISYGHPIENMDPVMVQDGIFIYKVPGQELM
jgi:SAM-dependent methyltransferase